MKKKEVKSDMKQKKECVAQMLCHVEMELFKNTNYDEQCEGVDN